MHERADRAAEHARLSRVVHVAVVVDPFGGNDCAQDLKGAWCLAEGMANYLKIHIYALFR